MARDHNLHPRTCESPQISQVTSFRDFACGDRSDPSILRRTNIGARGGVPSLRIRKTWAIEGETRDTYLPRACINSIIAGFSASSVWSRCFRFSSSAPAAKSSLTIRIPSPLAFRFHRNPSKTQPNGVAL
jgi:hypothetical protein